MLRFTRGRFCVIVGIFSTMVYFHHKELILGKMWFRGPKALFGWFRNCLKSFLWLICGGFVAQFVKCPWNVQSMV